MNRSTRRRNGFRRWCVPAAIFAVLLLALAIWLLPRRVSEIVSVDEQHRWERDVAPPRRAIVWQPARPLTTRGHDARPQDSVVRPQLADGGISLYYTIHREEGGADIYRSSFDGQKWLPGEPVESLNSTTDDFGPAISSDGRELYLYSDRPGGSGGFDVYVSHRAERGWSTPRNLGPLVNTPANEYDPAISPDGTRLYFTSNRTPAMQERQAAIAKHKDPGEENPWKGTLRADMALPQFDLYFVRRAAANRGWELPAALEGINSSLANEGEPFVSPDGAFLYFASDRANASGERTNFDLFRARLTNDRVDFVENLGAGVNTAASEHDPALSPEGFRIVFSRNRGAKVPADTKQKLPDSDHYALYISQAAETYDDATWDTSHLAALANAWWWIVLALLVACLLAAIIWYLREVSLRRAPLPLFFLLALLLHLLLVGTSFIVKIGGESIASHIHREFKKIIADDVRLESTPPPDQVRENAFESVADLESVTAPQVSVTPRRLSQTPNVIPSRPRSPGAPNRLLQEAIVARIDTTTPQMQIEKDNPQLDRRQQTLERLLAENTVKFSEIEQEIEKTEQPSRDPEMKVDRRTQPSDTPLPSGPARRSPKLETLLKPEELANIRPDSPADAPSSDSPAQPKFDRTLAKSEMTPDAVQVPLAQIDAPSNPRADKPLLDQVALIVPRQSTPSQAINPIAPARPKTLSGAPQPLKDAMREPQRPADTSSGASAALRSVQSSLERKQASAKFAAAGQVKVPISAEPDATAANIGHVIYGPEKDVTVNRVAAGASSLDELKLPAQESAGSPASLLTPDADAQPVLGGQNAAPESAANFAQAKLPDRRSGAANFEIADARITPAQLPGTADAPSPSPASASLTGPKLDIGRSSSGSPADQFAALNLPQRAASGESGSPTKPDAGERQLADESPQGSALAEVAAQFSRAANARADLAAASGVVGLQPTPAAADAGEIGSPVPGAAVTINRQAPAGSNSGEFKPADLAGGFGDADRAPSQGELAKLEIDSAVPFGPVGSPLARRTTHAPLVRPAEGKVGLQAMLRLRVGDEATKRELIEAFGGQPDATLRAVREGLTWLARVQQEDGHWDLRKFANPPEGKDYSGHGTTKSHAAATGLALLPFLGDGHTHQGGKYQATVDRGIRWLIANQKTDGDLFTEGEGNAHMYSHGIAAIALCEAYGMTKDEALREPAQRAVNFIVKAQHGEGGWRYRPKEAGDTSVVGWQMMALKSAQMAGLEVPPDTLERAKGFIQRVRHGDSGEYRYQPGSHGSPAMTAEAMLCYQYLGAQRGDAQLLRSVEYISKNLPEKGKDTSYYWYYATQAMYHMGGTPWQQWNKTLGETLLTTQVLEGPNAGTWDAKDQWEQSAGRIYSTSLRLLMLEVSFRHLPLYQAME